MADIENLRVIDSRIAPMNVEWMMLKKRASSVSGTPRAGYLPRQGVDTSLVTGVTASARMRTANCDGLAEDFRSIAVNEANGDTVPGACARNLFDSDAKFADEKRTQTCVEYPETVGRRNDD